ncbi:MAG: hypothetical protein KA174_07780 [Chitinophagales bacterium]|jgi:hypothetical protein|nr:hypothetical protein [Saprospirales bacterium]MBP6660568.1 hypothetical protein [Chitinophagales bacterium]
MEEKEYEIPIEGSLGLLAIGHIGLQLWREKRAAFETENDEGISIERKTDSETNSSNLYFGKISE